MFLPQVNLHFLVESRHQEFIGHHKSKCELSSQHHFISCLHGVYARLCWPGTSRGDQEAGARGTGKGHRDKVSHLYIPFPKAEKSWNISVSHTWPNTLEPKISYILIQAFLLFCCFCCEVQEPPEEEALGVGGGQLAASMRGDRHVVETSWNTSQAGK